MRKEEILSLTWKQVDLERERLLLEHTKNGQRRSAPLRGRALELIRQHVLQRRPGSDFLFPGEKPSPKKPCRAVPESDRHFDITAPWTAARKEAKISDFRFHDLRHTTASYLAMNGASLIEIAGVLDVTLVGYIGYTGGTCEYFAGEKTGCKLDGTRVSPTQVVSVVKPLPVGEPRRLIAPGTCF